MHNVALSTEKAAIHGVLGAGVDVELQESLVRSIHTRDLERVDPVAVRGVGNLGTVVGEGKGEVRYEAQSGLRSCKDEAKSKGCQCLYVGIVG